MKRPLILFTSSFSLGIFAAPYLALKFYQIHIIAFAFLIFSFLFRKNNLPVIFLAFLSGVVLFKNSYTLPLCHIAKIIPYQNRQVCIVRGTVDNNPQINSGRTNFIFKASELQFDNLNRRCCGRIMVCVKGKKDLSYGEELMLRGRLYPPFNFGSYRGKSYRDYLRRRDIWFKMSISSPAQLARSGENKGFFLKKLAFGAQKEMERVIYKELSPVAAAVLSALALGQRNRIPAFINNSMIKSGTVHVLVVSGLHVGIVVFALLLFLKILRLPKKLRFALAIAAVIFYCLITGASVPVVRATVMAVILLLAYILMREPDIYNSLSISALFILCANPGQLFEAGFQLSFTSVVSLVWLYPKIKAFMKIQALKAKWLAIPLDGLLVSFSAWLGTMGLIAYYFRTFSPVTVLANLFIVPLAAFITLSGFSLIFISFSAPFLSKFFAYTVELSVATLIGTNAFLAKLPYAYFSFK